MEETKHGSEFVRNLMYTLFLWLENSERETQIYILDELQFLLGIHGVLVFKEENGKWSWRSFGKLPEERELKETPEEAFEAGLEEYRGVMGLRKELGMVS